MPYTCGLKAYTELGILLAANAVSLTRGVICLCRVVRVTMRAAVFCTRCSLFIVVSGSSRRSALQ